MTDRGLRKLKLSTQAKYTLSPLLARRLAITRQRLAGPRAAANANGILDVVRSLGCLQLDPISVVARSHLLVLWSRLGTYDLAHLNTLLWREWQLFEYWAHCASLVLTEDYPIHQVQMRSHTTADSPWAKQVRAWIEANTALRQHILTQLHAQGPQPANAFEDKSVLDWSSSGWTAGRNVSRMLDFLWARGEIMVAGRSGLQKLWDLTEHCLPAWTPCEALSEREVVRRAALKSLRALGVARPAHIQEHFIRGCYPNLTEVLTDLEAEGIITTVQINEDGYVWPGPWYIHS